MAKAKLSTNVPSLILDGLLATHEEHRQIPQLWPAYDPVSRSTVRRYQPKFKTNCTSLASEEVDKKISFYSVDLPSFLTT